MLGYNNQKETRGQDLGSIGMLANFSCRKVTKKYSKVSIPEALETAAKDSQPWSAA